MFDINQQKLLSLNILFLFLFCQLGISQHFVQIQDIVIEGNRKTKNHVILNELNFSIGDSIEIVTIDAFIEKNRQQVLSTGLFNEAKLLLVNWNAYKADIVIDVQENWYIFPTPIFELADRNFNVWWQEQGRSLDRINYGVKLSHYNFVGNKDPLRLKIQFGYIRKFELDYVYPYLNKERTLGIGGNVFYSDNKEIAYITEGNKPQFRKTSDERVLLNRFRAGLNFNYRPNVNFWHNLRLEFHRNGIDPFVRDSLNVNYFLNNRTSIRFFFAEYDFQYDKRIYPTYPQGGFLIFANVKKEGFGIFNDYNNLQLFGGFEYYYRPHQKLTLATRLKAKTNLNRGRVSYANNTGLGWLQSDVVSGFDLYVMDGTDYVISTNSVRLKFFDKNLKMAKWLPRQFEYMSMQLFFRFNFDYAYVNERDYTESNSLNNRWFYGFGPALDVIIFNNFLYSFEYSINDLGEHGLFIQTSVAF
jgi:outer membrane protein assembly factor BamA